MGWQTANAVILHAGNTIINPNGLFVYDGAPAAGNLVLAVASVAGTDQFGNAYGAQLQVGNSTAPAQVLITQSTSGQAAEVSFPMPAQSLSNVPNVAGGVVSGGPLVNLLASGPALAAGGFTDWVQTVMFSNDGSGTEARMEFRYVDTSGTAHVKASYDGTGWTISGNLAVTTINGSANTGTAGLTDGTINGSSSTAGLANGQITGTSGGASAGTAHTHGAGNYAVTSGQHSHSSGSYAVTNGTHNHAI